MTSSKGLVALMASIPVLDLSSCKSLGFAVWFLPCIACLHMRSLCLVFASNNMKDGNIQEDSSDSTCLVT